jgi:phospholipid/cholesterol/gamma-HCH transport system permease protein
MPKMESETVLGRTVERLGRACLGGVEEIGTWAAMLGETVFWTVAGKAYAQPVRLGAVFREMTEIGIRAIPIVAVMSATIGVMLAIQGIYTLRIFGAEWSVTIGITLSMTREFAPMITGILVAGRSGSALAARVGTMKINQEIDALQVMGINPVRFLVAPPLIALLVMVPSLTFLADVTGLFAAGLYVRTALDISLPAYWQQVFEFLTMNHLSHGLGKSFIFAVLIGLIGIVNGASVTGGAEGVGRVTTRAVVQAISAIIVTDMFFAFVVTR